MSLKSPNKLLASVKGILMTPIQYEVRVPSGNWAQYFGHYENQKWGTYDSNSCWLLGGAINEAEDQLEWLWKNGMFGEEAKNFFTKNGYIDSDGDFSLSERFLEILGGARDNGHEQMYAWDLMQRFGCIPRSMLNYTNERAQQFSTKADFNKDYFNPQEVTQAMKDLGVLFTKYIIIGKQKIGRTWTTPPLDILKQALKQAPLAIGVPVPRNVYEWNNAFVQYDGKVSADHCIELYGIDDEGQYLVFDQYEPHLKVLSADYYLPIVTQGILSARTLVLPAPVNPVPQNKQLNKNWTGIFNWMNGIFKFA